MSRSSRADGRRSTWDSRPNRRRPPRRVAAALAAIVLAAAALPLASQAPEPESASRIESIAILDLGPLPRRGIDELAPDVTPHWYGRYRVGAALVAVRFLDEPLPRAAGWSPVPCEERPLRALDGELHYHDAGDFAVLVHVESGTLPVWLGPCRLVDGFVSAHLRLATLPLVSEPGDVPLFPAVIEL